MIFSYALSNIYTAQASEISALRREAGESRGLKAQLVAAQTRVDDHRDRLNEEKATVRKLEDTLADVNASNDELQRLNERLQRDKEKHEELTGAWSRTKAALEASISEGNDHIAILQAQNVTLQKKVRKGALLLTCFSFYPAESDRLCCGVSV